jgi:Protein of unknown function (DUF1236)
LVPLEQFCQEKQRHFRLTLAALILASGSGAAVAIDDSPASGKVPPGASSQPSSGVPIHLSSEQENTVWQRINNHSVQAPPPSQLTVPVGAVVPDEVPLQAIPDDVAADISSLKAYDYAIVQDRLLIVNRSNKTVVHVINATLRDNY